MCVCACVEIFAMPPFGRVLRSRRVLPGAWDQISVLRCHGRLLVLCQFVCVSVCVYVCVISMQCEFFKYRQYPIHADVHTLNDERGVCVFVCICMCGK